MDKPLAGDVINDAAIELGLKAADLDDPFASTDPNFVMLCRLLKRLGRAMVRARDWTHLSHEYNFSTVDGTDNYALPNTAFTRIIDGSIWNRTTVQQLVPVNAAEWQAIKARGGTGAPQYFRTVTDQIYIYPTPTAVEAIHYEFINKLWVMPTGQTAPQSSEPTLPTDTLWFDEPLLVYGLKLAFLRARNLNTGNAQDEFNQAYAAAAGGDGASRTLPLSSTSADPLALTGYVLS